MNESQQAAADRRRGMLLSVIAYLIWGVAGLYWYQLEHIDTRDLVAHRALWSVPVVAIALLAIGRLRTALSYLTVPRIVGIMALAALCSAANWGIFLWAVLNGKATEASLGYFLLPLLNVALGLVVFKESIDGAQRLGIGFAIAAVLVQLIYFGGLPWVALGVAISFGVYGAIRKAVNVGSLEGLLLETLMMSPFALVWLWWRGGGGLGEYGLLSDALLIGAGVYTAVPLMAYVAASRLLPLTALGLVFYIGPTTQLIVAMTFFREPVHAVQLLAFALVWAGLAVVTIDGFRRARHARYQDLKSTEGQES